MGDAPDIDRNGRADGDYDGKVERRHRSDPITRDAKNRLRRLPVRTGS